MSQEPSTEHSSARLEAFSDGVIAVIITIMVLEFKVPHESGLSGLHAILPTFLVYGLSFAFTGLYWVNHHLLLDRIESVDPHTLYANLLFLFSLSLLPFATSWLLEKERTPFSAQLYTASLIAAGTTFMLLRLAVRRRIRLTARELHSGHSTEVKHWVSLGLYVVGLPLAIVSPTATLFLDAAITLFWVVPDLGTTKLERRHRPASPSEH